MSEVPENVADYEHIGRLRYLLGSVGGQNSMSGTLDFLRELKPGWDSYSAMPINQRAIAVAEAILSHRGQATPLNNGGVQIEWHCGGVDVEFRIRPDGTIEECECGEQANLEPDVSVEPKVPLRNKRAALNMSMQADARVAFSKAVSSGRIVRAKACQKCGASGRIDAHHDDYAKPLDVQWLCRKCHGIWHQQDTHRNRERTTPLWIGRKIRIWRDEEST